MRGHQEPLPTGYLKLMPAGPCTVRDSKRSSPVWSLQGTCGFAGFDHTLAPPIGFPGSMSSLLCASLKLSPAAGGTAVTAAHRGVSPVQRRTITALGGTGGSGVKRISLVN